MYVEKGPWAELTEGGMVEREQARNVYETFRYTVNRDPALLEWVDGSTFKMRVFPIAGRHEKRIILSYTQRLPLLYEAQRYRFPGGINQDVVNDWQFRAVVKNGAKYCVVSDSHPSQQAGVRGQETGRPVMDIKPSGNDYVAHASARNIKPNHDVTLDIFAVPGAKGNTGQPLNRVGKIAGPRLSGFVLDGHRYLMLRHQPDLVTNQPRQERRDWVFLFETGANRDPLLARTQIEIVRTMLENAGHGDTFSILTAAGTVRLLRQGIMPGHVAERGRSGTVPGEVASDRGPGP